MKVSKNNTDCTYVRVFWLLLLLVVGEDGLDCGRIADLVPVCCCLKLVRIGLSCVEMLVRTERCSYLCSHFMIALTALSHITCMLNHLCGWLFMLMFLGTAFSSTKEDLVLGALLLWRRSAWGLCGLGWDFLISVGWSHYKNEGEIVLPASQSLLYGIL